jgi:hypothetical protein
VFTHALIEALHKSIDLAIGRKAIARVKPKRALT